MVVHGAGNPSLRASDRAGCRENDLQRGPSAGDSRQDCPESVGGQRRRRSLARRTVRRAARLHVCTSCGSCTLCCACWALRWRPRLQLGRPLLNNFLVYAQSSTQVLTKAVQVSRSRPRWRRVLVSAASKRAPERGRQGGRWGRSRKQWGAITKSRQQLGRLGPAGGGARARARASLRPYLASPPARAAASESEAAQCVRNGATDQIASDQIASDYTTWVGFRKGRVGYVRAGCCVCVCAVWWRPRACVRSGRGGGGCAGAVLHQRFWNVHI